MDTLAARKIGNTRERIKYSSIAARWDIAKVSVMKDIFVKSWIILRLHRPSIPPRRGRTKALLGVRKDDTVASQLIREHSRANVNSAPFATTERDTGRKRR